MLDMHKELIKALLCDENLGSNACKKCAYAIDTKNMCMGIDKDAATAIQTLTEQVEDLQAECAYLNDFEQTQCHHLLERLSEVAAERDEAPVVHGRWDGVVETEIYSPDLQTTFTHTAETCSACKQRIGFIGPKRYLSDDICPNCGARMDLKEG